MTKGMLAYEDKGRVVSCISLLRYGRRRACKSSKPILSLKAISQLLGIAPTTVKRYLVPALNRGSSATLKDVGRPSKLLAKHIDYIVS